MAEIIDFRKRLATAEFLKAEQVEAIAKVLERLTIETIDDVQNRLPVLWPFQEIEGASFSRVKDHLVNWQPPQTASKKAKTGASSKAADALPKE